MKRLLIFAAVLAVAAGCQRGRSSGNAASTTQTETIAPATAQPSPQTGSDPLTQTTEIEDSRSEEEGGATSPTATATAKTTTAKTTKAPAGKKKHKS